LKEKLLTVSMFIIAALVISALFFGVFSGVLTRTQDGIVDNLKRVENY